MPQSPSNEQPFAAPCCDLDSTAPLNWVRLGWQDYCQSMMVSLGYGFLIFLISLSVSLMAWAMGRYMLVVAMLSGFVIVAPLLATGMYSVSRQLQRKEKPSFVRSIQRMRHALNDSMVFALILLVIFLVWVRAGAMVHVFFPADIEHGWLSMWPFFAVGSAVGSIFAFVSFSASAFSLPMIVDRNVDMVTACVTSINAVLRNKRSMVVWVSFIVLLTAAGFATLGLGLIIVIPLLAYATYHGYVETIGSSDWPPSPG